jgi:hypothetical protein
MANMMLAQYAGMGDNSKLFANMPTFAQEQGLTRMDDPGMVGGLAGSIVDGFMSANGVSRPNWITTDQAGGPPKISATPTWYDVKQDSTLDLGINIVALVLMKQRYTNYLMPMLLTMEQNVITKTINFMPGFATAIGPRGAWDLGTTSTQTSSAFLNDKAFGYVIEQNYLSAAREKLGDILGGYIAQMINVFADTLELLTLQQIRNAMQEVMMEVDSRRKMLPSQYFFDNWRESVATFDLLRKDPKDQNGRGIFQVLTKMGKRTKAIGGLQPTYAMCSQTVKSYITQHTQLQSYSQTGDFGPEMLFAGPDGLKQLDGKLIITPELTNVQESLVDGALSTVAQVGDYNLPLAGSVKGDFRAYDMKSNSYVNFTFDELMKNCWAFDEDEDGGYPVDLGTQDGHESLDPEHWMRYMFHYVKNGEDFLSKARNSPDASRVEYARNNKRQKVVMLPTASSMTEAKAKTNRARLVGHMRKDILSDSDLEAIVDSMSKQIKDWSKYATALSIIEGVQRDIAAIPYNKAANDYFDAIFDHKTGGTTPVLVNPSADVPANGINAPFAFGFKEIIGPNGTVPVVPAATANTMPYPLGYDSLQGMRYIASLDSTKYTTWAQTILDLKVALPAIDELAAELHKISPGNKLLTPRAASSVVHKPTLADAFFENFVSRGLVPLWNSKAAGAKPAEPIAEAERQKALVEEMKIRLIGLLPADVAVSGDAAGPLGKTLTEFDGHKAELYADFYEWIKVFFTAHVRQMWTEWEADAANQATDAKLIEGLKVVREFQIEKSKAINAVVVDLYEAFRAAIGAGTKPYGDLKTRFGSTVKGLKNVYTDARQKVDSKERGVKIADGKELARSSLMIGAEFVAGLWRAIQAGAPKDISILPSSPFNHHVPATRGVINAAAIQQYGAFGSYMDGNTAGVNGVKALPFAIRNSGTFLENIGLVADVGSHLDRHHGDHVSDEHMDIMKETLIDCWKANTTSPAVRFVLDICNDFAESTELRERFIKGWTESGTSLERCLYLVAITTPVSAPAMKTWWRCEIHRPFTMGIFRLFATFRMSSLITGTAGAQTGYTLIRPFQWHQTRRLPQNDILIGGITAMGHLFTNRSNIYVQNGLLLLATYGGYDSTWLKSEDVHKAVHGDFMSGAGSTIVLILPRSYETAASLLLMASSFAATTHSRYFGLLDDTNQGMTVPPSFALYAIVGGVGMNNVVLGNQTDDRYDSFHTNEILARGTTVYQKPDGSFFTDLGNGHLAHLCPEVGDSIARLL